MLCVRRLGVSSPPRFSGSARCRSVVSAKSGLDIPYGSSKSFGSIPPSQSIEPGSAGTRHEMPLGGSTATHSGHHEVPVWLATAVSVPCRILFPSYRRKNQLHPLQLSWSTGDSGILTGCNLLRNDCNSRRQNPLMCVLFGSLCSCAFW